MSGAHVLQAVHGTACDAIPIRRALLSVSDKSGLLDLARSLAENHVELISTGGTAKLLLENGFQVTEIASYTGSPEILDGRVKTLHPKVHGGLLFVRGNEKHEQECKEHDIKPIDLVVMNLYPFEETVKSGAEFSQCVENIDIGGPSMLRSAAKNHQYVTILSSPHQYGQFLSEFTQNGTLSLASRRALARDAFTLTARYDSLIAAHFLKETEATPEESSQSNAKCVTRVYEECFPLKYGCNPHQNPAAIFNLKDLPSQDKLPFEVVNGAPGYINLLDACNALQLVHEASAALGTVVAASFKHCSPAGVGTGNVPLTATEAAAYEVTDPTSLSPAALAYIRARNADPLCSYGDFIAVSGEVDDCLAKVLKTEVCDGIIADGFTEGALSILLTKKKGKFIVLRGNADFTPPEEEFREVFGCAFMQKRNTVLFGKKHLERVVCGDSLPDSAQHDLILASIAVKYTQSNSIGYALNGQMIGIGAGQQSRVDCIKLAGRKVKTWYLRMHPKVQALQFKEGVKKQERVNARVRYIEGDFTPIEYSQWKDLFQNEPSQLTEEEKDQFLSTLSGVSLSSDAFFPFRDSIDHSSKYGVQYVVQPGGSIADEEVLTACKEYGITVAFSDLRLFHH